jgi:hypothetical protein
MKAKIIAVVAVLLMILGCFQASSITTVVISNEDKDGTNDFFKSTSLSGGGTRRAVIVGIADYKNINDLQYTDDDAYAMENILTENGWGSHNIDLLIDNQASKSDIVNKLNNMATKEVANDISLFFFSGHGTTETDTNGDEGDGSDEALCPWDTSGSTSSVLLDDELKNILDTFDGRVVVILDSCYSGGMPQGGGTEEFNADNFINGMMNELSTDNCIILMACAEDEYSYEDSKLESGVFSFFLVEGLTGLADANGNGEISAIEAFDYADPLTRDYKPKQHPQIDVNGDDIPIIGGYEESTAKVKVYIHRIKEIDQIDPLTDANWEYTVRVVSDDGVDFAFGAATEEVNDWYVEKEHVLNVYSSEVTITLKLFDRDEVFDVDVLGDIADISGHSGGGIDNWNIIYEYLFPGLLRGAMFYGTYDIINDEFTSNDELRPSDGYSKTSGDYDGSTSWWQDENDAAIWFKVESTYVKPTVDAGGPYYGITGRPVSLQASVTGGITDYEFNWDLDNDGQYDDGEGATVENTWHLETTEPITIGVKVTDGFGISDEDKTTVDIKDNEPPNVPTLTANSEEGVINKPFTVKVSTTDPNLKDKIEYFIDWGDGTNTGWFGPFDQNVEQSKSHTWGSTGYYTIKAKARDPQGAESDWSTLRVRMPKTRSFNYPFIRLFDNLPILNFFYNFIVKIR